MSNEMGDKKTSVLVWKMGLPMILSMVLQALYNVVDTVFVVNMGEGGTVGNLALSAAFPVQIFMVAIGVGTGVGLNASLSRALGEGDAKKANATAGNGLFLVGVFYLIFLAFGLFCAKPYMRLTATNEEVAAAGTQYLSICCCVSIGSIGFAVAERFLISTGKTAYSTAAQVAGAVTNVVLDYAFIYPLRGGIAGAAWATVIGQIVSFVLALVFHYALNREIDGSLKHVKPSGKVIKEVYRIGFPAFLMQAMLSLTSFAVLLVIGSIDDEYSVNLLSSSYGIYYKLMQAALFASFGLSNAVISIVSFNYGMKSHRRVREITRHALVDSVIVTSIIAALYAIFADPVSRLFALTAEQDALVNRADVVSSCALALRICSLGYVFMGISVAAQGVLQGLGEAYSPLLVSALRLIVVPLPLALAFASSASAVSLIWWSFPIADAVAAVVSIIVLLSATKRKVPRECENA